MRSPWLYCYNEILLNFSRRKNEEAVPILDKIVTELIWQ